MEKKINQKNLPKKPNIVSFFLGFSFPPKNPKNQNEKKTPKKEKKFGPQNLPLKQEKGKTKKNLWVKNRKKNLMALKKCPPLLNLCGKKIFYEKKKTP